MYYGPLGGYLKIKGILVMSIWKLIYMKYNYKSKHVSLDNLIFDMYKLCKAGELFNLKWVLDSLK